VVFDLDNSAECEVLILICKYSFKLTISLLQSDLAFVLRLVYSSASATVHLAYSSFRVSTYRYGNR